MCYHKGFISVKTAQTSHVWYKNEPDIHKQQSIQ